MSFLDMMTNYLGAVIILFLVAAQRTEDKPCPQLATRIEANLDTENNLIWADLPPDLEEGDSLVVHINRQEVIPGGQSTSSGSGTRIVRESCQKKHLDDCPQQVAPGQCAIVATWYDAQCEGGNQFTFKVNLEKIGTCGSSWKDETGRTGIYGTEQRYGPFPINGGAKTIRFTDASQSAATAKVTVPPPACNNSSPAPSMATIAPPPGPGLIQFAIEFDEVGGDRIGLRVKSGKNECSSNDKRAGDMLYVGQRVDMGPRPKTGYRMIYTEQVAEGTYEIKLEPKEANNGQNVRVKLYVVSKNKPGSTRSFDLNLPLSQGRQVIKTVQVMGDGSLVIR